MKRTFVRQSTEDNCGIACLAMLLKYAGRTADVAKLCQEDVSPGGLSLKELRDVASSLGLYGKCVEMDMGFLKKLTKPVILHTVNQLGQDHFQVCYGYFKRFRGAKYLLADPAIQLHYVSEADLSAKWKTRAALYFDSLDFDGDTRSSLIRLLRQRSYPLSLLFTVPILSLCIGSFGVALTWLLQRGLTSSAIFNGQVIYSLLVLLFVICIFRNLFSFLRQYVIMQINVTTNMTLMDQLVKKVMAYEWKKNTSVNNEIKSSFINIQRMQNAIGSFIAVVLSDGCVVVIFLASSFYIMPVAGLVNLLYVIIVITWEVMSLPDLIFQTSMTKMLSSASEQALINQVTDNDNSIIFNSGNESFSAFYANNLNFAKQVALSISRKQLLLECLGTLSLMLVISLNIFRFKALEIDYESLMLGIIEAYLITAMMQRICGALQQIAEGADAVIAHTKE